jgi:hypothetical protein
MPEVQTAKDKEILLRGGLVGKDDARIGRGPPEPRDIEEGGHVTYRTSSPKYVFAFVSPTSMLGFMASVTNIKCPSCGVEEGPCTTRNGQPMFHTERQKAAYPTTYEFPDCAECRTLTDDMVNARYNVRGFQPPDPRKSRSRWPQAYKAEMDRIERHANLTKAAYELHLVSAHKKEMDDRTIMQNLNIVVRDGRLNP